MSISKHYAALAVFAALLLFAPAQGHGRLTRHPVYQQSASNADDAPEWKPDASLVSRLDHDFKFGAYHIRPPQGYTLTQKKTKFKQGTEIGYLWLGTKRPDKSQPGLLMVVTSAGAGYHASDDVSNLLQSRLDRVTQKTKMRNFTHSEIQSGLIHGRDFSRVYWKGQSPKSGKDIHGLLYQTVDGNTYVYLASQDDEPYNETTLPLAEASVMTFRKQ